MNRMTRIKTVGVFLLKFVILAPVCLLLWWLIAPAYVWLLGQVCGVILVYTADIPVEAVGVTIGGIFNTDTMLIVMTKTETLTNEVGHFVNNVPPYVILVLATPGLGFIRRMRILGDGVGILVIVHVLFLVVSFALVKEIENSQEVAIAIGKFLLTLPFGLWIVLAYWDKLTTLLAAESRPVGPSAS